MSHRESMLCEWTMKIRPIFHPFILTLYFFLLLLASNLGVIRPVEVIRPIILSVLGAVLIFLFLQYQHRDWALAGLICTPILFIFFSYGHLHLVVLGVTYSLLIRFIPDLSGNDLAIFLHPFLIVFWIGVFLYLRRIIRRFQNRRWEITKLLNLVTVLFLVWPIFQIIQYHWNLQQGKKIDPQTSPSADGSEQLPKLDTHPDIYYIILDGYAREDTLASVYDYDNGPFLDFLRDREFLIANISLSNYAQTVLSVASSLNMDYLNSLDWELDPDSRDVNWLIPIVRQGKVRESLEINGYQIVALESGYDRTEIPDSDLYLQSPTQASGTFESLWIRTSALLFLEDMTSLLGLPFPYAGFQSHIARIKFIFNELPLVAELPGPKFVFAHILVPHPPFVFDSDGEVLPPRHKFGLRDGSDFQGTSDEYIDGYRRQVDYVNRELELTLPKVIANSATPPIIILQGDHGPAAYLDWRSPQSDQFLERMAILNAMLIPGYEGDLPTDELSPVNTFRWIFNLVFEMDYPLLEDRSYFSATYSPFDFTEVMQE